MLTKNLIKIYLFKIDMGGESEKERERPDKTTLSVPKMFTNYFLEKSEYVNCHLKLHTCTPTLLTHTTLYTHLFLFIHPSYLANSQFNSYTLFHKSFLLWKERPLM